MGEVARIVLASSSRYRREMLARLGIPFEVCSPDVDEATEGRAVADPYRAGGASRGHQSVECRPPEWPPQ